MRARIAAISILSALVLGPGTAAAQEPLPNPNADLNQWLSEGRQKSIDDALRSAKEHAAAGRRDEAIADYKKVLGIEPAHPDAMAGLKALGGGSAALPTLTLPSTTGSGGSGSGGGGPFPGGLQ